MPSKKKVAKPAKKHTTVKKSAPAKKKVSKPASASKTVKPAPKKAAKKPAAKPAPKKADRPVAKPPARTKAAPKPAAKTVSKPVAAAAKNAPKKVKPNDKKPEVKQPVMPKKEEKKPEAKKPEPKKIEVKKPEAKKAGTKSAPGKSPAPKKPVAPAKPIKVVIPEMKTKTVRKYEPEFTKSVLDQPEQPVTGPTMRYSDADLQEFRELIQKKLEQAKKELTYLQGLITRKDEMGGDEHENRYMTMEDGSMSMEREQLAQMASRQIHYIDHLEKAIMRIENRTYGICRVTGKLIDKARLRAVPHATLSIEAKQMMNK